MSATLDDIWDAPLDNEVQATSKPERRPQAAEDEEDEDMIFRPSRRSRSTLFLDEANEDADANDTPAKNSRPEDIDALFAELEDIEQPASTKAAMKGTLARSASTGSSKPFDIASLRRDAQKQAERDAPPSSAPSRKYVVQSSSPPPEDFGNERDASGKDKLGDGGRKTRVKLDETRLLDADGFPRLVQLCKDFKPKGKGHELSDLNRLFSMYQFWAHNMFPVTQFSDTVSRIEKLCHSKRMNVSLSVWKDEIHGTINGKKMANDTDIDMHSEKGDDSADEEGRRNGIAGPVAENHSSAAPSPASSRAPSMVADPPISQAPSSDSANEMSMDEDPFDMEDFLALRQHNTKNSKIGSTLKTKGSKAAKDLALHDDDDSAMWAEAVAEMQGGQPKGIDAHPLAENIDDDEAWAALDEMEGASEVNVKADKPRSIPDDAHRHATNTIENILQQSVSAADKPDEVEKSPAEDDDWADMYV